jgi:hypothetical protein
MSFINLDKKIARLIIFQRIELANYFLIKIRKFFGRYLFTNFFTKFFIFKKKINFNYYNLMKNEYSMLKNYIEFNEKKILSIGAGMGGLELIINSQNNNNIFTIIEKNYISKKIRYGWDNNNLEAYNNLKLLKNFFQDNGMKNNFDIYDFDKDKNNLPKKKFDLIISLYSLDYHYDFNLYKEYIKTVSLDNTLIIFDTIRPDYFQSIFRTVRVISTTKKEIHSSKRIICNNFIN